MLADYDSHFRRGRLFEVVAAIASLGICFVLDLTWGPTLLLSAVSVVVVEGNIRQSANKYLEDFRLLKTEYPEICTELLHNMRAHHVRVFGRTF